MTAGDPPAFEFATAGRILFGAGRIREAGDAARSIGRRAFLVTGANPERSAPLRRLLDAAGVSSTAWRVYGEPTVAAVAAAVAAAREAGCDCVVGFGGGSALDAAKAVAALAPNPGEPADYLEIVGAGRPLAQPSLPCMAIPTTAGTGSEATRNAVLGSPAHGVKVSLRGPTLLPRIALVDPGLTRDLPPAITAATGMDALAQLIEPYVCLRASPFTDALCREGMARVARSLRRAFTDGGDDAARLDMSLASLCGGIALANAGLGAVHGFASPVGGRFGAPHGAVCAALLAPSIEVNLAALRSRGGGEGERRYADVARILTGRKSARADEAAAWVRTLVGDLGLPGLGAYGVLPSHFELLSGQAAISNSMKANPAALTAAERVEILARAL
jgi:alcohol dehydrogenase class IV